MRAAEALEPQERESEESAVILLLISKSSGKCPHLPEEGSQILHGYLGPAAP